MRRARRTNSVSLFICVVRSTNYGPMTIKGFIEGKSITVACSGPNFAFLLWHHPSGATPLSTYTRERKREREREELGSAGPSSFLSEKPVRNRLLYSFCLDFLFFLAVSLCFVGNAW